MTHHTQAELLPCPFCGCEAHFEMDDDRWEWIECGSCGMQGNRSASLMEDCKPKLAEAWNRRAPAAPVPQVTPEMIEAAEEAYMPFGDMGLAIQCALSAAPKPPEAAPVEFPEPVAYRLRNTAFRSEVYEYFRTKYLAECRQKQFNASVDDGGLHELTPIYTEQQVRALLAAHGIQEQST
ncbi:Lar family restriction alleviation protein [Comamonas aquatica]|uniref:Lar family restriction alleviation protein n=1 Tax=Comamonas aquatica TaxID=225991 RepID=UPI0034D63A2F